MREELDGGVEVLSHRMAIKEPVTLYLLASPGLISNCINRHPPYNLGFIHTRSIKHRVSFR